jgi:hypothetical protein
VRLGIFNNKVCDSVSLRARMNTLPGYIEMAEGYYERAMSAEEDEAKLEHLGSIEAVWPDYRNVGTLIERLGR